VIRNVRRISAGKPEDLGVCGRSTMKQAPDKCIRGCGVDSVGVECGPLAGCCDIGNETGLRDRSRFSCVC
jgi:hypothetical protein